MAMQTGASIPPQVRLLHGCYLEAERADRVALGLEGLRDALSPTFHGHILNLLTIIRQSALNLRDLATRSHVKHARTSIVADHLNTVLPCMSRTLHDITAHYEDKTISRETRWKKMYHNMLKEADGMPLLDRFVLYNRFLVLLGYILTRDRRLDHGQFDRLRTRIISLRRLRERPDAPTDQAMIAAPPPPAVVITAPSPQPEQHLIMSKQQLAISVTPAPRPHWCERVFTLFAARTDAIHAERHALLSAVPTVLGHDPGHPAAGRVLMRRSFDGNRFCVKFILAGHNEEPCVMLREFDSSSAGMLVAWKWHNDLVPARMGNMVVLKSWSERRGVWKDWVRLRFVDWEELVLFYTAFVVLKARNPLSTGVKEDEYTMANEEMLFQAKIVDDGYAHTLMVKRDCRDPSRMRLLTAVSTGELIMCPVWTALVPVRMKVTRVMPHVVVVKGLQVYVFCQNYHEGRMRQHGSDAFEIYFVREQGADEFMRVWRMSSPRALGPANDQEYNAGPSNTQ